MTLAGLLWTGEMSARDHVLLTDAERAQLFGVPTAPDELARRYSLEAADFALIRERRHNRNRLGVALQIALFRHPGMPLRVVAEFGNWRRVEDQDGAGGWVHYSLLSGVRTAIVTTDMAELRSRPDQNGAVIARAEAGAIVRLHECSKDWCRVSGGGEKGWVPKTSLWGVDADELRD